METSIQYIVSNIKLFNEVYGNWSNFSKYLDEGPESMKKYLLKLWNETKEELKDNKESKIKDIDKKVTINDFDVSFSKTNNNISVFFITLPDYDGTDAASKYIALALTPNLPRYFTLEYSSHFLDKSPCWVIGEFAFTKEGKVIHHNYGSIDNMRLSYFAGYIVGMLEGLE